MRGDDRRPDDLFSYIRPAQRVPADHPLRPIRTMVDTVLRELSPEFARLYAMTGRPSIRPEKLLRALLIQVLYTVRSERQLMEQLNYNLRDQRNEVGLACRDRAGKGHDALQSTVMLENGDRSIAGEATT
jgi:transposase